MFDIRPETSLRSKNDEEGVFLTAKKHFNNGIILLKKLSQFEIDNIHEDKLVKIERIIKELNISVESAMRVSKAISIVAKWEIAVVQIGRINLDLKPLLETIERKRDLVATLPKQIQAK